MATVHAALVSAYPTETEARNDWPDNLGTYRGIWTPPTPEAPEVHVFSDATDEQLVAGGWVRVEGQEA